MSDVRQTLSYKNYMTSLDKWRAYCVEFDQRGALWFQLEDQVSQPETADITIHGVTAKKSRWREILSPSREVYAETNEYVKLNINPVNNILEQANYLATGENLEFMKDTFAKANDFIKSQQKVLEELVANVRKYPTTEQWNAYKDSVKELTGDNVDDLGEAKKGVIATAEKLAGGKKNLMIVLGVVALLVYFFMFHKKK